MKNFIQNFDFLVGITPLRHPFNVNSVNGPNLIGEKCKMVVFGHTTNFFILPSLKTFDGIIGFRFLKEIGAVVDTRNNTLKYNKGKTGLPYEKSELVNFLALDSEHIPRNVQNQFREILRSNVNSFADPNRALPYNTAVEARIRTKSEDPIYARSYPYPASMADFVNGEIDSLLRDGIIRKSSSPYNSPIHVVEKKGVDEKGNPNHRLVIDFRKLNENTIDDKYPMPDISIILSNLGKSKYFSTLDLKSGFHQIKLTEKDRQKTAFSVNNGKYEFCRLPFGLKNAPSIFQRAIDDVLRDDIGKICQVYMDDIIVYSPDEHSHLQHVDTILKKLEAAGMRVSPTKSKFFKTDVNFLGFVVTRDGIRTCPEKVRAIAEFKVPQNLKALRSFLGLSGYYRKFVRDYARIAKPLTKYLRGENGHAAANNSRNIKICLDKEALEVFDKLKRILASEDILLAYPDYSKSFELTTDASGVALGAVLSQNGKPITMISRTLSDTEMNYATNERELLAIVWALKSLRHFLYGVTGIHIFTDHQPLTFAMSDKNPNAKMKRWRAFIEEFSPKFFYKPGRENVVADALSRQYINQISDDDSQTAHSEISSTNVVKSIKFPVNQFKNQILISKGDRFSGRRKILFQRFIRHTISYNTVAELLDHLANIVDSTGTNAIHCDLPTLADFQDGLISRFPSTRFIHTEKFVMDVIREDDQWEIVANEHNRAHRSSNENFQQIINEYYFPGIKKKLKYIISNCKICKENKYQRKPQKAVMTETPIPSYPGEILHVDIIITDKQHFLSCVDKFSKFAIVIPIASRSSIDVKMALFQIMNRYRKVRILVSDNEKSLKSGAIAAFLRDHFGTEQFFTPPMHSTSNGQVERFHSTLLEIARCVKAQQNIDDTIELMLLSTIKYNDTVHSVTGRKPLDILNEFNGNTLTDVREHLRAAQHKVLERYNKDATTKRYQPGEVVFIKRNRRLGNKFDKFFMRGVIQRDLGTTVLIDGRKVHKDNLR